MAAENPLTHFVAYNPSNGRITQSGYSTINDILNAIFSSFWTPSLALNAGSLYASEATHYVNTGTATITAKAASPITKDTDTVVADGVDDVLFSNIPSGTVIRRYGPSPFAIYTPGGTTQSITFSVAGAHHIVFDMIQHLRDVHIITAT